MTQLERGARTAAALTKQAVIAAEGGQAIDAGLGGSAGDGSAVATYSLTISRGSGGMMVEIDDSAMAGDDDPRSRLPWIWAGTDRCLCATTAWAFRRS